jgi:oligopeptide transport system substrate-binding protein
MKRISFFLLSLALAFILLATGCPPLSTATPTGTPTATPTLTPTGTPTVTPTTPPVGGTLNLYGIDPYTLDPAVSSEMTSHGYVFQIFSGLVRIDDNLIPAPDIARSWDVSQDGKTYTFHLRRDAKFHNGREVKADDFKYSWERACAPATGSQTAPTYLGDIVGVKDMLAGKANSISGVRVIDDYTLEVTIDAPRSYFLSKLTYPTTFVVDKDNVASGGTWWLSPNGTGPFKLKEWKQGNRLVLEKNRLYHGEVAKVDSVVFQLLAGVPMSLYETGDIDVTGVSLSDLDRVADKSGPFYHELSINQELSLYYIGFNAKRPPFDDANIRRAFTMALDKDKMASLVYKDMVQRADGILPPGIPGFNKDISGLKFDVNQAKQLIKESKYGDVSKLPPITITTSGYGATISQSLEAIIYQWRENLGVEVKVRQLDPQTFFYHLMEEKDGMFDIGWIADYPHPQDFLELLFRTGTENNYGEYSNPEIDALLDKASVELDSQKSMELYQQIEQKLVNDAACLPLWFSKNYLLVKPYVKGYVVNPLGVAVLNRVYIEPH